MWLLFAILSYTWGRTHGDGPFVFNNLAVFSKCWIILTAVVNTKGPSPCVLEVFIS